MEQILLPGSDLTVSRFCLGAGAFGTAITGGHADRLLAAFVEAGGSFVDTAHCYAFWAPGGLGASERELAESLRRIGAADSVVIATKGGHPDAGPDYRRPEDFLSESVIESDIDDSLSRLQTDCIDLFYLHRDDRLTPVDVIMETVNRQAARGRVRAIGASNWSVARMAAANAYARTRGLLGFSISQVQWSLSVPEWQTTADPTMRAAGAEEIAWHAQTGVPIAAYSATGGGLFGRAAAPATPVNAARWQRARDVSEILGCTPTQVALAWLLHQKPTVIPVFSTASEVHLREAIESDRVRMDPELMARLTSHVPVGGE